MAIKAIVLDFDGVIIDDEKIWEDTKKYLPIDKIKIDKDKDLMIQIKYLKLIIFYINIEDNAFISCSFKKKRVRQR